MSTSFGNFLRERNLLNIVPVDTVYRITLCHSNSYFHKAQRNEIIENTVNQNETEKQK